MVKVKLQKKNLPEAFTNWCPILKKNYNVAPPSYKLVYKPQ